MPGWQYDSLARQLVPQMAEALPHFTAMVASELHDHDEHPHRWCDSQTELDSRWI